MKGATIFTILIFSIFTASCSTFMSTAQMDSDFSPGERSYYNQSSIINKALFAENKNKEVKPAKPKREKSAIEELNEIHQLTLNTFVTHILSEAESYIGVPYRYGGTTRRGIDCSAFVQNVFQIFNQELPRVSAAQAKEGYPVSKEEVRAGDLVFFATHGRGRVSHVGIVHNVNDEGEIEFIHASTSRGVIVTSLNDTYWSKRFLYAKRILD
ncbi:MAG: NlpC/P60 family protein [Weeksellaceae bacterium]